MGIIFKRRFIFIEKTAIAIVGAREATHYGKNAIRIYCYHQLSKKGLYHC